MHAELAAHQRDVGEVELIVMLDRGAGNGRIDLVLEVAGIDLETSGLHDTKVQTEAQPTLEIADATPAYAEIRRGDLHG